MSDKGNDKFDSILLGMAQQHSGGVPEVSFATQSVPVRNGGISCKDASVLAFRYDLRILGTEDRFLRRRRRRSRFEG